MYPILVSWISFLIPPDIVPGRMTLLITVFLVLVNIFNTITTNIPKVRIAKLIPIPRKYFFRLRV